MVVYTITPEQIDVILSYLDNAELKGIDAPKFLSAVYALQAYQGQLIEEANSQTSEEA